MRCPDTPDRVVQAVDGPLPGDALEVALVELASESGLGFSEASQRLSSLSTDYGLAVYSRFIHLLCHVSFSPAEASVLWQRVVVHTRNLAAKLERPVDFRIGLADYFVSETRQIPCPVVIDFSLFHETEAKAFMDAMTGLFNFRYLQQVLPREIQQARRLGYPLSMIFVDVDNFKAYNDRFGHAAGDEALGAVAGAIRSAVRDTDLPCRYGGEEFAVVLPATDKVGAMTVAERITRRVEGLAVSAEGSAAPSLVHAITVSCGVASFPADAASEGDLIARADSAMYQAKVLGKNRALSYSSERRASYRRTADFTGSVRLDNRAALPVNGADLSQHGLFFFTPEELAPGKPICLDLEIPVHGEVTRVSCKARVVRCQSRGASEFGIGAAFTYIQPADMLRFYKAVSPEVH